MSQPIKIFVVAKAEPIEKVTDLGVIIKVRNKIESFFFKTQSEKSELGFYFNKRVGGILKYR